MTMTFLVFNISLTLSPYYNINMSNKKKDQILESAPHIIFSLSVSK